MRGTELSHLFESNVVYLTHLKFKCDFLIHLVYNIHTVRESVWKERA